MKIAALIVLALLAAGALSAQPAQNDHVLIGVLVAVDADRSDEIFLRVEVGPETVSLVAESKTCIERALALRGGLPVPVRINFYLRTDNFSVRCYDIEGLR